VSLKSKPYYWLECDHEGCDERNPSLDNEVDAWSDEEGALEDAAYGDWTTTDAGEHYCPDHRPDEDES